MKEKSEKQFGSKYPSDRAVDPEVSREVKSRSESGNISCASAFEAALSLGVSPEEVGFTVDRLELHITHCQLGLYGYGSQKKLIQPAEEVAEGVDTAVRSRLENGRLPCRSAWDLAGELGMGKMEIASACEAMGIKISSCQLGAF